MENRNHVIRDYIADILEQVSSLMEKWEPYEKTRESLWEMLEDSSRHSGTPEEKQTLLMDYEMSLILASISWECMRAGSRTAISRIRRRSWRSSMIFLRWQNRSRPAKLR